MDSGLSAQGVEDGASGHVSLLVDRTRPAGGFLSASRGGVRAGEKPLTRSRSEGGGRMIGSITGACPAAGAVGHGWPGSRGRRICRAKTAFMQVRGLIYRGLRGRAHSTTGPGTTSATAGKLCARGDLNPYVRGHQNLNLARLPISPLALDVYDRPNSTGQIRLREAFRRRGVLVGNTTWDYNDSIYLNMRATHVCEVK